MEFLNPEEALRQFGLYGAQDVADLGAGAGHFSLAAARRLEGGRLFAIDVDKEMLARLVAEAREKGHAHVHPIWGDLSKSHGVPLGDGSLDRALAISILFQIDDRDAFVREVHRMLKPGGKVLLVDWKPGGASGKLGEFGPHSHHKVSPEVALGIFTRHGFIKERDIDAGNHHYGMILVRT